VFVDLSVVVDGVADSTTTALVRATQPEVSAIVRRASRVVRPDSTCIPCLSRSDAAGGVRPSEAGIVSCAPRLDLQSMFDGTEEQCTNIKA
jgi:hypothetical protein